jgi:hypothetical protein
MRIEARKPVYTVTFVCEDGTEYDSQRVIEGHTAVLPENPEKEGFTFVGWNMGTTNIRSDMTIVAVFVQKEHTVVFIDWDEEEFSMQTFKHGEPILTTDIPEQFGGVFAGWVTLDGNVVDTVTDNMVVTAKFDVSTHIVTFFDKDGNEIKTEIVEFGEEVLPPQSPPSAPNGLVFRFWDTDTSHVMGDVGVFPVFGFSRTAETPVASVESGIYRQAQTVSLTAATRNVKIYYFAVSYGEDEENEYFDFENPFEHDDNGNIINGTLYTAPIKIESDTLLFYVSVADGMNDSDLGVSSFVIDPSWAGDNTCNNCKDCNDCGFLGGEYGFGKITNEGVVTIGDALEILKFLAGMSNAICNTDGTFNQKALAAARITTPGEGNPTIGDALEVLKYLAGLETMIPRR